MNGIVSGNTAPLPDRDRFCPRARTQGLRTQGLRTQGPRAVGPEQPKRIEQVISPGQPKRPEQLRWYRRLGGAFCLLGLGLVLAGCGGGDKVVEAEPLEPQPYGIEETNVEVWLDSLEVGSRELYAARDAVVAALALKPGERIADIGSGTGLYTVLFSPAVGTDGLVYAVDIEPRFLKVVNQRVDDLDIDNVLLVLSRQDDITLPPQSTDTVFIADSYHYFRDPQTILASIRRAIAPGGRLVIIDYNLSEAARNDPDKEHLRFGKDGLVEEVEAAGFELEREADVDGLTEFYFLIFRKT